LEQRSERDGVQEGMLSKNGAIVCCVPEKRLTQVNTRVVNKTTGKKGDSPDRWDLHLDILMKVFKDNRKSREGDLSPKKWAGIACGMAQGKKQKRRINGTFWRKGGTRLGERGQSPVHNTL